MSRWAEFGFPFPILYSRTMPVRGLFAALEERYIYGSLPDDYEYWPHFLGFSYIPYEPYEEIDYSIKYISTHYVNQFKYQEGEDIVLWNFSDLAKWVEEKFERSFIYNPSILDPKLICEWAFQRYCMINLLRIKNPTIDPYHLQGDRYYSGKWIDPSPYNPPYFSCNEVYQLIERNETEEENPFGGRINAWFNATVERDIGGIEIDFSGGNISVVNSAGTPVKNKTVRIYLEPERLEEEGYTYWYNFGTSIPYGYSNHSIDSNGVVFSSITPPSSIPDVEFKRDGGSVSYRFYPEIVFSVDTNLYDCSEDFTFYDPIDV